MISVLIRFQLMHSCASANFGFPAHILPPVCIEKVILSLPLALWDSVASSLAAHRGQRSFHSCRQPRLHPGQSGICFSLDLDCDRGLTLAHKQGRLVVKLKSAFQREVLVQGPCWSPSGWQVMGVTPRAVAPGQALQHEYLQLF